MFDLWDWIKSTSVFLQVDFSQDQLEGEIIFYRPYDFWLQIRVYMGFGA